MFFFFKKKRKSTTITNGHNQVPYKSCGHSDCELSARDTCCSCGDKRPSQPFYEQYVDGKGYVKSASRDTFYCQSCRRRCSANINPNVNTKRNTSSNNNTSYNKKHPYCPHSIYPTTCMLCNNTSEEEQKAVKEAVRQGFPMNQVTKVARNLPNKDALTSSEEFLQAILETIQKELNPHLHKKPPPSTPVPSNNNSSIESTPSSTPGPENLAGFKHCGHYDCQLDCIDSCCQCGDKRPIQSYYEEYIDGKGFVQSASRHTFYCPGCRNRIERGSSSNRRSSVPAITPNYPSYSVTNPYCPHSIYPTTCMLCTEASVIEQRAVKDAVRLGFSMTQVTKAARSVPNKTTIKTSEAYLQAILDILEKEQNANDHSSTYQPPVASPVVNQIPNVLSYQSPPYYYPPSTVVQIPNPYNPYAIQPPVVVQPSAPPLEPEHIPHPEPSHLDANEPSDDECKVCFEAAVNSVLIPCGHLALCYSCAMQITKTSKKCPICRNNVSSVIQTFKA